MEIFHCKSTFTIKFPLQISLQITDFLVVNLTKILIMGFKSYNLGQLGFKALTGNVSLNVDFWFDNWTSIGSLKIIYPHIF